MSKIYFIVGAVGTGTTIIAGELLDSYRKNSQLAVIRLLGVPEKIKNAGTRSAAETLGKIESMIAAESSADAVIFSGWRVPDHINEIFNSYPLATYIFTNASSELQLNSYLKSHASEEDMAQLRVVQQSSINNFISTNSIEFSWNKVVEPVFDASRNVNVSEAGDISIAVHGTL
jgi:hypothetical protein